MFAGHGEVNKGPSGWGPGPWGRNPFFSLSPGVLEGRRANGGEAERVGDGQGLASSAVGGAVKHRSAIAQLAIARKQTLSH